MRKSAVLATGALLLLLSASEAFAHSWCNTRNHCRPLSKRYVAGAMVGCYWLNPPLCYHRSSSCGPTSADCGPKACLWGQARAWATNGAGGCHTGGWRTGDAYYGEPDGLPEGVSERTRGDHDVFSRVEFDADAKEVHLYLDRVTMTSTTDNSYSRLDLWLYLEPEEDVDEVEPTEENTVWHA
ncbi:MAG: hypothetical protein KDD47_19305, partial [Acidobacteria bacterium]|nr:hypothetical protein [Acidobacteriota bacterium]